MVLARLRASTLCHPYITQPQAPVDPITHWLRPATRLASRTSVHCPRRQPRLNPWPAPGRRSSSQARGWIPLPPRRQGQNHPPRRRWKVTTLYTASSWRGTVTILAGRLTQRLVRFFPLSIPVSDHLRPVLSSSCTTVTSVPFSFIDVSPCYDFQTLPLVQNQVWALFLCYLVFIELTDFTTASAFDIDRPQLTTCLRHHPPTVLSTSTPLDEHRVDCRF